MTGTTWEETPVGMEAEGVEIRMTEIGGGMTAAFLRFSKGTDMGDVLKGMPDDLCQCPHWGFMFKGRVKLRTKHGDEFYEAGQAFYMSPGHAPEALEDCELLDISPSDQWNELIDHIKTRMPEMA
jgi:hypothetical protein